MKINDGKAVTMHSMNPGRVRLADLPRWVEPNDLLAQGGAEAFQFEKEDFEHIALLDPEEGTLFVVGKLITGDRGKLTTLLGRCTSLILEVDQDPRLVSHLGEWTMKKIFVFTRPSARGEPVDAFPNVGFLDQEGLRNATLEPAFRNELREALSHSPVSATFIDGRPVAFCYAASQSHRFWDVSIDTLPDHRRKGYARQCALHMMQFMETQGKQVVWQSFEDNPPSWKLAQSLGLIPTDQLLYLEKQA